MKKQVILVALSSIVLIAIYLFLVFPISFSYQAYAAIHMLFALMVLYISSKIDLHEAATGLYISLIVGLLIFIPNAMLLHFPEILMQSPISFVNAPDPLYFLVIFLVGFNTPFLLHGKYPLEKATNISLLIMALLQVVPYMIHNFI